MPFEVTEDAIATLTDHSNTNQVIRVPWETRPSPNLRDSTTSSLGTLDPLPVELLHDILTNLDAQSVANFGATSLLAYSVADSLPAFRDLKQHIPHTLVALTKTRLVRWHSIADLHRALKSSRCVSCSDFGPFLFLPTCERCCFLCLRENASLWLMPIKFAATIFDLQESEVKQGRVMYSIPGEYFLWWKFTQQNRLWLICGKDAKKLALQRWGSYTDLDKHVSHLFPPRQTQYSWNIAPWFANPPFESLQNEGSRFFLDPAVPTDRYSGMGCVDFPILRPNDTLETGLYCAGCKAACADYWGGRLLEDVVEPGTNPEEYFIRTTHVARTHAEFCEHITSCLGAQALLRGTIQ